MTIYCRSGSANNELSGVKRLQDKRKPLVLGHASIDNGHSTRLNRSLYDLESRKRGWSKLVYLFGILYCKFYLEVLLLSDVLAADPGRKFHLAGNKECRQQGYHNNNRKT